MFIMAEGKTQQHKTSKTTYKEVKEDFYTFKPSNISIKKDAKGKEVIVGTLPDGRTITARESSSDGPATMEFRSSQTTKIIKVRYVG